MSSCIINSKSFLQHVVYVRQNTSFPWTSCLIMWKWKRSLSPLRSSYHSRKIDRDKLDLDHHHFLGRRRRRLLHRINWRFRPSTEIKTNQINCTFAGRWSSTQGSQKDTHNQGVDGIFISVFLVGGWLRCMLMWFCGLSWRGQLSFISSGKPVNQLRWLASWSVVSLPHCARSCFIQADQSVLFTLFHSASLKS
jgi:hypothetical protein